MAQVNVTDTGTGKTRPIEVAEKKTLAISNVPATKPPEPSISAADVAGGKAQLSMLQPHAPDPVFAAQARDARMKLRGPGLHSQEQTAIDWIADQPVVQAAESLIPFKDYLSPVSQFKNAYREPGGIQALSGDPGMYFGIGALEYGPLKGFFSRFETEVLPRLSEKPQQIGKLKSILDKGFVPKDQLEWMGIDQFLEANKGKNVTRSQVDAWFREHQIKVQEKVAGGQPSYTPEEQAAITASEKADEALLAKRAEMFAALDPSDLDSNRRLSDAFRGYMAYDDEPPQMQEIRQLVAMTKEHRRVAEQAKQMAAERVRNTRYAGSYTLPGKKENYREHHLILPAEERYRDPSIAVQEIRYNAPVTESKIYHGVSGAVTVHYGTWPDGADARVVSMVDYSTHPEWQPTDAHRIRVGGPNMDERWFDSLEEAKAAVAAQVAKETQGHTARDMTYSHGHFDVKDYFLHSRGTMREIPGVGKTWFVDEAQSDAHQAAAKYGYRMPGDRAKVDRAATAAATQLDTATAALETATTQHPSEAMEMIQRSLTERADKSVDQVLADVETFLKATTGGTERITQSMVAAEHARVIAANPADRLAMDNLVRSYYDQIPVERVPPHLQEWARVFNAWKATRNDERGSGLNPTVAEGWHRLLASEESKVRAYVEAEIANTKAVIAKETVDLAPPNFPFKKSWEELALRIAIRDAVEHNADAVGFPTGQHILNVYNQSLQDVGSLTIQTTGRESMTLTGKARDGRSIVSKQLSGGHELAQYMGETNAKRLLSAPPIHTQDKITRTIEFGPNESFLYGNKGVGQQYDKTWIKQANAIGKEHGVQVEKVSQPDVSPDFGRRREPAFERQPFMDPTEPVNFEREHYERADYEGTPEPEELADEDFEPNYDAYDHYVETDTSEFQNNATEANEEIETFRRDHAGLFGEDPTQRQLFDMHTSPRAPRRGVTFEVQAHEDDWQIVAHTANGEEIPVFSDFVEFDDPEVVAEALRNGEEVEPTQWRYTYREGRGRDEYSEWFDSERETERAAEEKREELDDAAYNEQYEQWTGERRDAHRQQQRDYESEYADYEAEENAAEAAFDAEQDALEADAQAAERARIDALGTEPNLAQLRAAHDAAEDARHAQWLRDHPPDAPDPKSLVSILRLPEKFKAAVRKGQPLPEILLPLTGAGMALMASHKRQEAAKK